MKWLRSSRGSSSVLVALVLIILVVFSVLAVTTSTANLRLARKNAETVKAYYNLDSEGERFLNDMNNSILLSRDKASATMLSISEGDLSAAGLSESVSVIIGATLKGLTDSHAKQQYLDSLYPRLVMYYTLESIVEAYPGSVYSKAADYTGNAHLYSTVPVDLSFRVRKTFILEFEHNLRYLNVDIEISDPEKDRDLDDICDIREWRLWQEPFEFRNELDLWEGRP